jgi:hypothetical protein
MSRTVLLAAGALLVATVLPAVSTSSADAKPAPKPKLTAKAVTVSEGKATAVVQLKVPTKAKRAIKVSWRTKDGTAKAGSDYRKASGTATIKKGKTSAAITVRIIGDAVHERTESFTLTLASKQAKTPGSVRVTITDNDAADAPAALVGTITVSQISPFPTGTTTLTMNTHLVRTSPSGAWRDDGTGSWTMTGSLLGIGGICPFPITTTISGSGTFLPGDTAPVNGQSTLLLDDFDAIGASGTPTLAWSGVATSSTPSWVPDPFTPGICTSGPTSVVDYPFSIPSPGASGTYSGTTGPGRGVDFDYTAPGSITVMGSLTPAS